MRLATSPWSPLHAIYPTKYSAGEMLRVNFEVPSYGTTPILAGSAQGRAASTSRHGVDRSSLLIFFPTPLCSGAVLGHTRYIRMDISNSPWCRLPSQMDKPYEPLRSASLAALP